MTTEDFAKVAWDAYKKAVGDKSFDGKPLPDWAHLGQTQKFGWSEAVAAVFDDIHTNMKKLDHKYKATANWQQLWDEVLAFIIAHIPGTANTAPKHHK